MEIKDINDQIYISSFNDPTVALETTQSNQTYSFTQTHEPHGDVENQEYLQYFIQGEQTLMYSSPDGFNYSLQPSFQESQFDQTKIFELGKSIDQPPVNFGMFREQLVLEPIETVNLTQGKLEAINLEEFTNGYATGIADI